MNALFFFATILAAIVLALAIIGSTVVMAIKIIRGEDSPRGKKIKADEARMIQEIYQGLSRMEERIGALETIILDHKGKDHSL